MKHVIIILHNLRLITNYKHNVNITSLIVKLYTYFICIYINKLGYITFSIHYHIF